MTSKAYPPTWATDEAIRTAAGRWQRLGLLNPVQQAAINAAHPISYYQPPVWIRVVLFGATFLGGVTALGFLLLTTSGKLDR